MKATKKVCSLIPIMFITISELKIQKVVCIVDNKEVTIETQVKTAVNCTIPYLTPLNEKLDVPSGPKTSNQGAKEKDIAEETDIVLNHRKDTLALNSCSKIQGQGVLSVI